MDQVLQALSLAMKAGKVVSGEFSVLEELRAKKLFLVLYPVDASDNTKKRYRDKCTFHKVPCYEYATKESLGHWIGREHRAGIGITDENFAAMIEKKLMGNS